MYPPKEYAGKDTAAISQEPDRHRALQVRALVEGRRDRDGGLPRLLAAARPKIKTVVFKPIPDDAVRVAALQNGEIDVAVNIPPHLASIIDKHPKIFLSHRAVHPDDPADVLHAPDGRQSQADRPLRRAHRRQARASGHRLRDRRRRDHQERDGRQGRARGHHAAQHALRLRPEPQADQAGPGQDQEAPRRGRLPQRRRDHAQRAAGTLRA